MCDPLWGSLWWVINRGGNQASDEGWLGISEQAQSFYQASFLLPDATDLDQHTFFIQEIIQTQKSPCAPVLIHNAYKFGYMLTQKD